MKVKVEGNSRQDVFCAKLDQARSDTCSDLNIYL